MNHFNDVFYASWLVLLLCLLQRNVAYSQTQADKDTKIFLEKRDATKFNHLVVDKDRGFVFIGAVDLLYQLSSDLELVASWRQDKSSLKCDDFKDASNGVKKSIGNYNKILVLDHYHAHLISCWSTCYGSCKIYQVETPLREMKTVIEPIVSRDENASTVAFTVSDQYSEQTLHIGVTIMASQSTVLALSQRALKQYTEPLVSLDSITLRDAYQGKYIVNYIYGFSSGDFIYFLTTQMNSTQPSLYISKLIRASNDLPYRYSYAEIQIECFDEKERKYNLAQAAFVGKPGSELADSLGITPEDDVLFGIFAQSEKQTVGYESSKPSNRSAMCIYSLKEINEKFVQNIQRCSNETGYQVLEFIISPDQKCRKNNAPTHSKFHGAKKNMPLEGNYSVKTNASFTFDTLVTAVCAQSCPNNFTTVFVGSNTGHLQQIVVRNKFNAYKYKEVTIDEGFAINSDFHFDSKTDHLFIMTERKLTKIKVSFLIPSIASFQPTLGLLGEIINITILGNNLAGSIKDTQTQHSIVVAGIPCITCRPLHSAKIVCTINTRSINLEERKKYEGPIEIQVNGIKAKSIQNFEIFDPKIERIFPTEGSRYGGNKLIIYGENFIAKSSVDVYIGNISCSVLHHEQNEITCITGPSPVINSSIAIKLDENFRIFNNTYKYFDTDLDEEGHNLTLKGIPAGGITIFMHNPGLNKTSLGELFFQVNNNSQAYNSTKCEAENSTMFTCLSPHMPEIDSYSIDAENPRVFNYSLIVSLDRTHDGKPLLIRSSKFFLYPNPVFEHYSVTELGENIRFVIKGRNVDNVCHMDDFAVRVGDENCKVFILSRSDLICQLQISALRYNYSKNTTKLYFSVAYGNVTVKIGNNTQQVVPYINAVPIVSTEKLESDWIIYGLCFGALIIIAIFFILIKLLIAYRKKSFESLKISREMQQQINRMGMDAIAMRQCIKKIVVEKKIDVDGSLANILKLPNITIEYTPVAETNVETSPEMEFYLPIDTKWEFTREKLVLGKFLGDGEFGRVVLSEALGIIDENISTTVAVKMLKETHTDVDMIALVSEMEIMKLIGMHPNILRLLGCCTQNGPLLIITEYAAHGNLQSFLRKHLSSENFKTAPRKLSQRTLVTFGLQVAQGMEYLSSIKCVHRDLAARNILVSNNLVLKIADFGLARDIRDKDYYRKKSGGRLPVKWMAPEALLRSVYTTQSDVWSFGILLWEVVTLGGIPYPTFTNMEELVQALDDGYRMKKPQNCSMKMYRIMRECWNYLPENRPTFSMILEHLEEILSNADDNEISEELVSCEPKLSNIDAIEILNETTETDYLLG